MNRKLRAGCVMLFLLIGGVAPAGAADLTGQWSGSWNSFNTRHKGPLRCTLTKLDESSYQADFTGRFFKLIPFNYSVTLYVEQDGDTVTLSGQNYLGRRFGTFYYSAEADESCFTASYSSCKDCGQFLLSRCCW
jgi:hypothetical protein